MSAADNSGGRSWRARAERAEARVAELEKELAELHKELPELRARLAEALEARARDVQIIGSMAPELEKLKRKVFGTSSERMPAVAKQLRDEAAKPKVNKGGRRNRSAQEEAEGAKVVKRDVHHRVPDAQRTCPKCGGADLKPLGEGKVEHIYELVVAQYEHQRHHRETLACACGEYVVTAPGPQRVDTKSLYGAALCAHVLVAKCADSIPLYRMEKAFKRAGIPLSRSTLCDLFHARAAQLEPLWKALLDEIAQQDIVQADETTMRVMAEGKTRKSYLWTFLAGDLIAYKHSPSRSGETPCAVLGGTKGTLVVDAYTGYNQVTDVEGRDRAGCMAHVRRKFFESLSTAPDEARRAMELILEIYRVEHDALQRRLIGTPEHTKLRQTRSRAAMDQFRDWLLEHQKLAVPKSPLGKAISYALNQWEPLNRFVDDVRIPLDNNASERALRVAALGRKNYLFVGHDRSGANTAVIYSLVSTCEALGIDPQAYLADVMMRINDHPNSKIAELLPHRWKPRPPPDP
jgi:transposase